MRLLIIIALLIPVFKHSGKVVFDLPAIKGKSISQLETILGKPRYDYGDPRDHLVKSGFTANAIFKKDGFTLTVSFNRFNKKIGDYNIDIDKGVTDYKLIVQAGNLINTKLFTVYPVVSDDGKLYIGLIAIPK